MTVLYIIYVPVEFIVTRHLMSVVPSFLLTVPDQCFGLHLTRCHNIFHFG